MAVVSRGADRGFGLLRVAAPSRRAATGSRGLRRMGLLSVAPGGRVRRLWLRLSRRLRRSRAGRVLLRRPLRRGGRLLYRRCAGLRRRVAGCIEVKTRMALAVLLVAATARGGGGACPGRDPLRRPYFGDTHVHTRFS